MFRLLGAVALFGAAFAANAFTPEGMSDTDQTALQINSSGFICSEIVSMNQGLSDTVWNVRCIEFHDGSGRAHFAVDTSSGMVMRTY
ncbi:MAG: hypothetical protein ABJL99_19165 [Aliishimia sp.]